MMYYLLVLILGGQITGFYKRPMVFHIRRLFPPFLIVFVIVVLILLHLSYCVNVCHVFVCILSVYLTGSTMEISAFTFLCHPFI